MGHVWLIGMMGSGKSTVGRLVADRLRRPFYDTDELAEQVGEASIAELFARGGEVGFRALEKRIVEDVAGQPAGVIATGGGIVLDPANVATMRSSGIVVLLMVDSETLSRRIVDEEDRPLLANGKDQRLQSISHERDERYRSAADVIVDAGNSIDMVAMDVEVAWSES